LKMVLYKCFLCNKEIEDTTLRKRVRCIYCGSKMLYKPRTTVTKVKAI
jgi:DNA-directed RNA polymerase subunit P